jgi:phage terminase large subunit-like protein
MSYLNKIKDVDLERFNHHVEEYHQGWKACDQYAYNVIMGIVPTGKQVKNAVARYIYDRTYRTDIEFMPRKADQVIRFAGLMKHVKGAMTGKKVELLNWMIFVLANIYGWYYISGIRKGERRFNRAFTLVARGNAKSFLCSIVAAYTMRTSPNGSPGCYGVARQKEQAKIVFDDASKMIRSSDPMLKRWFDIKASVISDLGNDGSFKPMSQDSQSLDGYRVALGIADELHAHNSPELLNTLISGTTAVVDPLIFAISTAGINMDGVCVDERNLVREINDDIVKMDSYFGIEYALDDNDDWELEGNWHKANPSMGHSVTMHGMRDELSRARQSANNRKNFLTKYCNIFVNTNESPYVDILEIQKNCADDNLHLNNFVVTTNSNKKEQRELFLGLDLAQKFDIAALSFIFPENNGGISVIQRHYFPEGQLHKLTAAKRIMYEQWEEDGHLIFTPGNSTDFEYIKRDIRMAAKKFDLKMVGYDPYAGSQMALELEDEKIDMVEVRQGYSSMSEPAKLLQSFISDGIFNYQASDKCLEWQFANAAITVDLNENIKVHKAKDKPHSKVDSVIALITGLAIAKLKEPKKTSPYKKRGLILL